MRGFGAVSKRMFAAAAICALAVFAFPATAGAAPPVPVIGSNPTFGLVITTGVDNPAPVPGRAVGYTIVLRNTGDTTIQGAVIHDDLTGVLDDASYLRNASDHGAGGSFTFDSPTLTWTGNVPPNGKPVRITFTGVVNNPTTVGGNNILVTKVSGPANSNCATGSTDLTCRTTTAIAVYSIDSAVSAPAVGAGNTLTYTISLKNTSPATYLDATFTDDLSDILQNATYNKGSETDNGAAGKFKVRLPELSWTGNVGAGKTVTINFTVTANNPGDSNKTLVNKVDSTPDTNCGPGSAHPGCTQVAVVATPASLVAGASISTIPLASDSAFATTTSTPSTCNPLHLSVCSSWNPVANNSSTQVLGESTTASGDPATSGDPALPVTGPQLIAPVGYAVMFSLTGCALLTAAYITRRFSRHGRHFRSP